MLTELDKNGATTERRKEKGVNLRLKRRRGASYSIGFRVSEENYVALSSRASASHQSVHHEARAALISVLKNDSELDRIRFHLASLERTILTLQRDLHRATVMLLVETKGSFSVTDAQKWVTEQMGR